MEGNKLTLKQPRKNYEQVLLVEKIVDATYDFLADVETYAIEYADNSLEEDDEEDAQVELDGTCVGVLGSYAPDYSEEYDTGNWGTVAEVLSISKLAVLATVLASVEVLVDAGAVYLSRDGVPVAVDITVSERFTTKVVGALLDHIAINATYATEAGFFDYIADFLKEEIELQIEYGLEA